MLLGFFAFLLPLLLELQRLQSLDLHHEIKSLLFFDPVLFETLLFLLLSVSDGDHLRVKHHLIHVLHIVMFLIEHLLRLRQESFIFFLGELLVLRGWDLVGAFLVHL